MNRLRSALGTGLARYLNQSAHQYALPVRASQEGLPSILQPGDVLLVEGNTRISSAIKYLTQSTWSHAALYIGEPVDETFPAQHRFIEADILDGVRTVGFDAFEGLNTICSSLIAQAFQSIRYPILPDIEQLSIDSAYCPGCLQESFHIRHHSLFVPRDFDLSPYFQVIKPTLERGFDYRQFNWAD